MHRAPRAGWRRVRGVAPAATVGVSVLTLVLLLPGAAPRGVPPAGPGAVAPSERTVAAACSTVNYTSTVDDFLLSYAECLPDAFSNSTPHPLAVLLHGLSLTETTPMSGGYPTPYNSTYVTLFAQAGFILLVLNTRTGSGFYVNSPFTGPQEQDVWDAIASEERRHPVSAVDVFGSSMGSMGAWLLAGHHPGAIRAIGAVLSFSDYFEEYAYATAAGPYSAPLAADLLASISGGRLPNQSALAERLWGYLSTPRLDPENYSNVTMYVVHGGVDEESPNNLSLWGYLQANNSLLNTTCLVASAIGEPANCTDPMLDLAALHPGEYRFRYIFEPEGIHTDDELNVSDMLAFWKGEVPTGVYWATPGGPPTDPPQPVLGFATSPRGCGTIAVDGVAHAYGDLVTLAPGGHAVSTSPCPGRVLANLTAVGAATIGPGATSLSVAGTAVLVATFALPAAANVTVSVDPAACGPVDLGGEAYLSGATAAIRAGLFPLLALPCPGYMFSGWTTDGAVSVDQPAAESATLSVNGSGSVGATFAPEPTDEPLPAATVSIAVEPATCGPAVRLDGLAYANGSAVSLPTGAHAVAAGPCEGEAFVGWSADGAVSVARADATSTNATVDGNGSILALYGPATPGPGAAGATAPPIGVSIGVLAAVGAGAAVLVGAAATVSRRRRLGRP